MAKENAAIGDRAQHLLKVLVERYIRDGQPVGSRTLARDAGLDLSPATIRNVLADLDDLGLVTSPHTSAGRIPTAQGYRMFVDTMLTIQPLGQEEVQRLKAQLDSEEPTERLLVTASSLLSGITRLAGVVMVPRREQATLRQVEFLSLSSNRVLVIMVVNEREVQNKIIHTARNYSASELQQAANYLNAAFAGRRPQQVREDLIREMHASRADMNSIMQTVIEVADQVFAAESPAVDDFVLAGQTNLMSYTEMADMDKLRQLFEAFNRKRDILQLLDQSLTAESMQIFIGEEAGREVLESCSVVTSPYSVGGQVVGVLGVIGPTRMAYNRVIPIVDVTAKLLGAALNHDA